MTASRMEIALRIAGLLGLAALAVGGALAPQHLAHAWLASLTVWLGWPLGCLALILTHALTGGRWGSVLRAALLSGVSTLLLVPVALIPWAMSLSRLYPWIGGDAADLRNRFYLNAPFLSVRFALYLTAWGWLGLRVVKLMRTRGSERDLRKLAPAGLIVLAFSVTFASIDLTMSLEPRFTSSIYGLIAMISMGLTAIAASVLLLAAVNRSPSPEAVATLGKLLQGLVLFWGYLDFMQLLIVWQSNLSADAAWYLARMRGGWQYLAFAIACCHVFLPAACLMYPPARRSLAALGGVAALLLAGEALRAWWLVLPAASLPIEAADIGAMLLLGAAAAAVALRQSRHHG